MHHQYMSIYTLSKSRLSNIILLFVLLSLIVVGFGTVDVAAQTGSDTLIVDTNNTSQSTYDSIQQAIWDADEGDRIELRPGVYHESVNLQKDVAIYAPQGATIEPNGDGIDATATVTNVTIKGVTIRNASIGVHAEWHTGRIVLENVDILNTKEWVLEELGSETNWILRNTTIEGEDPIKSTGSESKWHIENSNISFLPCNRSSFCRTILTGEDFGYPDKSDWTIRNSSVGGRIHVEDSLGNWSIENTSIEYGDINARNVSGGWKIRNSTIHSDIDTQNTPTTIDARYNYWGSEWGPGGDFQGSGTPASGNIRVKPFYKDAAMTETGNRTVEPPSDVQIDASSISTHRDEILRVEGMVTNDGGQRSEFNVSLRVNGGIRDNETLDLAAGESRKVSLWASPPPSSGTSGSQGTANLSVRGPLNIDTNFTANITSHTLANLSIRSGFPTADSEHVAVANGWGSSGQLDYQWSINGSRIFCSGPQCNLKQSTAVHSNGRALKNLDSYKEYHPYEPDLAAIPKPNYGSRYVANISVQITDQAGRSVTEHLTARSSYFYVDKFRQGEQFRHRYNRFSVLVGDTLDLRINRSGVVHSVRNVEWNVSGPAQRHNTSDGIAVDFHTEDSVTVNATLTLESPETGEVYERTSTLEVTAREIHRGSIENYQFHGNIGSSSIHTRINIAKRQDDMADAYREIEQRVGPLPDTIEFYVADETTLRNRCGRLVTACADGDEIVVYEDEFNSDAPTPDPFESLVRHELTHLAQDRMQAHRSNGLWQSYIEGHGSYEGSITFWSIGTPTLVEKPAMREFSNFRGRNGIGYIEARNFVAAVAARYGRQTMLDVMRNSRGESFRSAFRSATGESFDTFYDNHWHPNSSTKGPNSVRASEPIGVPERTGEISVYPKFTYQNSQLSVIEPPYGGTVNWDVDTDGNYELTGEAVSWTPTSAGEHAVRVQFEKSNVSLAQTQRLRINSVPKNNPSNRSALDIADQDGDGDISNTEVLDAINRWRSGNLSPTEMLKVIDVWRNG